MPVICWVCILGLAKKCWISRIEYQSIFVKGFATWKPVRASKEVKRSGQYCRQQFRLGHFRQLWWCKMIVLCNLLFFRLFKQPNHSGAVQQQPNSELERMSTVYRVWNVNFAVWWSWRYCPNQIAGNKMDCALIDDIIGRVHKSYSCAGKSYILWVNI